MFHYIHVSGWSKYRDISVDFDLMILFILIKRTMCIFLSLEVHLMRQSVTTKITGQRYVIQNIRDKKIKIHVSLLYCLRLHPFNILIKIKT